jgi:hypothetical protein
MISEPDPSLPPEGHWCRRCRRKLVPGRGDCYAVSIIAIADPAPPVFTDQELSLDVEHEIQQLLAQLRTLDEKQAQDQVYRRVVFYLCAGCYFKWIANPTGSGLD